MKQFVADILGPDFQSMVSKVLWTFVQAFGGVWLASDRQDWGLAMVDVAVAAGVGAALVPLTVYARKMAGNAMLDRAQVANGSWPGNQDQDQPIRYND